MVAMSAPLLEGLPDEIALLCLARIPCRYHHVLRQVSRTWRDLLASEEWHLCRKKHAWQETFIYAFGGEKLQGHRCYIIKPDSLNRCWKMIQVLDTPCSKREGISIEAFRRKLYIFGGCRWQQDATDEAYLYDVAKNCWQAVAPMPTARCYFVSGSLDEKLYITGGLGLADTSPKLWDIYHSQTNTWSTMSDPTPANDIVKFVPLEGMLHTIHREQSTDRFYTGIFDPLLGIWRHTKSEIAFCLRGPTIVVDGTLFMLDQSLGTRLMMWQKDKEQWAALGKLSKHLTRPPCQLTAIGRCIYVVGRGLSAVSVDIDMAAKVSLGGVLVCSYLSPLVSSDLIVESCKVITM